MPADRRWLLPDGVADVLPAQAQRLEHLRRRSLDLMASQGYQLVEPPLIEYLDSLLTSGDHDLDLMTFKLTDQLSGQLMGVRADHTPQVARIDAHAHALDGVSRYCYVGITLHTRPQALTASRAPRQLGAELYGSAALSADLEIIDLMLEVLMQAGQGQDLHVDLGHVAVFRGLADFAGLSGEQEQSLFDLYQRKALPELRAFTATLPEGALFMALAESGDDLQALQARLGQIPRVAAALQQLADSVAHLQACWPQVEWSIDATELRGYHYHTGLVFAAYGPQQPLPLAQGGRYDGVGEQFGRTRPATGFSCDLLALDQPAPAPALRTVLAPDRLQDPALRAAMAAARTDGWVVVRAHADAAMSGFTHQFQWDGTQWQIVPLTPTHPSHLH